MWSNVTTLLPIISHQRNRRWSQNKLRIQVPLFFFHACFVLLVDVTAVRVLEKKNVDMDRTHWAGVSLISLLPTPWKTLERRACLVTRLTEVSIVFQCLLGNTQLNVEAGTVLMLGFCSGSSQSLSVRRLKSLSFLEFCHFTHYLNCPSDFIMQENMDRADLSIIKGESCAKSAPESKENLVIWHPFHLSAKKIM